MLRFIKTFILKLGLMHIMSYSGYVFLGSIKQLMLCILLITISAYIGEYISDCIEDCLNDGAYQLLLPINTKIRLQLLMLILCLVFFVILPIIIMNQTSGIRIDNIFIDVLVPYILWVVGYIPKSDAKS